MDLAQEERYSRQIRFDRIGREGQERILAGRVVIVGCGALGTMQADALARAGVGYLRIIDRDFVELSNLQRQWLFTEDDAAQSLPKAIAARNRLKAVNSGVVVDAHVSDLTAANIDDLLADVHCILDGTDNFETRYLVNDFAVSRGLPWIYGGAVSSYGLKMAVIPGRTACFRCVYPEPPAGAQPTCETAGVLNSVTATIAAMQSADVLRILAAGPDSLPPRITTVDLWSGDVRQITPARDPECPACGRREFPFLDERHRAPISLCGRNAVQIHELARPIELAELAARLSAIAPVRANEFALRAFLPGFELTVFPDGRAIIKGTQDVGVARGVYAKYVGC